MVDTVNYEYHWDVGCEPHHLKSHERKLMS